MKRVMGLVCAVGAMAVLSGCLPPNDWNWNRPAGYTGSAPSVFVRGKVFGLDDLPLAGVKVCDASQCVTSNATGDYSMEVARASRVDLRLWKSGYTANRYVLQIGYGNFHVSHHLLATNLYNSLLGGLGGTAGGSPTEGIFSIAIKDYGSVPNTGTAAYLSANTTAVPGLAVAVAPAPLGSQYFPSLPYTGGTYTIYMSAIKTGKHAVMLTLPAGTKCGNVNGAQGYSNGYFSVDVKAQYINRVQLWCTN